ncbi:PA14 domain-containing protein [Hymenobacter aquaticus]|uniref:PA14 domain-containing protein n=1 Tax=Hymenobacter aquaticus TaxID=1867101 RepID=UPI0014367B9E|nr:PA14 domain-containing protein [Hymenobacter aquaticus]
MTGTYFANGTMAGAPVLRRVDAAMDFNWGKQSPGPGLPADNFSVRWEGLLAAPGTGSYRFVAKTGDEVRLWINGKKILDTWKGTSGGVLSNGNVGLAAGEKTTIKIEFAEGEGDAQFQLLWAPPGQAPQLIPTTSLYPLGSPTTPDPPGTAPAPKPVAAKPTPKPAAAKPAAPAKPVAVAKAEVAPKPAKAPAVSPEQAAAKAAAAAEAKAAAAKAKAAADKAKAEAKATEAKAKADKAAAKAAAEAEAKAKKDQQPEPLAPGVYVLTSRTTGKPLEVIDPYRPNSQAYQPEAVGAAAGSAALARSTAPQWKIESLGGGFYRLVVPGNNRVLEVLGSSTSNGADLDLWPYYSGNNQAWRIEPTEGGFYKLLAKHSNKALTAKDSANTTDSGTIHQWRFSGRENQMWKLQPVQAEEPTAAAMAGSKPGVGAHKMSIYPNPSNGVVQLRYELPEEIPMGWVLYNQSGAPVRVSDYRRQPAGPHHQTLDFTGLPAGDYNLRMTVGTVTTREQLQLRSPKAVVPTPSGN